MITKNELKMIIATQIFCSQILHRCNVCFYCQDKLNPKENQRLIYCIKCNTPIHIQCYFSQNDSFFHDQPWSCNRCDNTIKQPLLEINCKYCPHRWGAFKKFILNKQSFWAHLTCVSLNPYLYIKQEQSSQSNTLKLKISNSKGYGYLPFEKCKYCQYSIGYAIKCDQKGCQQKFHPLCWMLYCKYTQDFDELMKIKSKKNEYFKFYCEKHFEIFLNKHVYFNQETKWS